MTPEGVERMLRDHQNSVAYLHMSENAHNRRIRELEVSQHRLRLFIALMAGTTTAIVFCAFMGML